MLKKEEVQHIANLARIKIDEKETEGYQNDLSGILDYFAELQALDTGNLETIGHITGMQNVLRHDCVQDFGSLGKEAVLKNAPETKNGQIKVKNVL